MLGLYGTFLKKPPRISSSTAKLLFSARVTRFMPSAVELALLEPSRAPDLARWTTTNGPQTGQTVGIV